MLAKFIVLALAIVACLAELTLACNGFKAKILKLDNCAGDDGIIIPDKDFSVKLTKKCELVPSGCIINKAFATAVAKYKVQKDGVVMKEGKMDLCGVADQATTEAKNMLKLFGAPSSCPVAEEKICSNDHKVDISKYKNMLSMARGNFIVDADIQHDTGKSCFHAEVEIRK